MAGWRSGSCRAPDRSASPTTFPCSSPYGRRPVVVFACALAHVRSRALRPRRRPHPHRRTAPAGMDEDVRRVPRAARAVRRSPTPTTSPTSTANRASTASARCSPPAASCSRRAIRPTHPATASVSALGNRKNDVFQTMLREEGIEPYPGLGALPRPPGVARHEGRRGVVVAQRARGARGVRTGAAIRRRRRRRAGRDRAHRRQAGARPVPRRRRPPRRRGAEGRRRRGRDVRRGRRPGRRIRPRRRRRPWRRSRGAARQRCRRRRRRPRRAAGGRP